jgi:hypothetical protein
MRHFSGMSLGIACLVLALTGCRLDAQNLIIHQLSQNLRVVIYELPDPDGRDEVIRYLTALRSHFWPDAELVDAGQLSAGALRRKFQPSCVLYTTLGEQSKLVRLSTSQMGWEIRGGNFQWRGSSVPLGDVRFILAAKNPYAKGHFVVYAAGSNHSLAGINGVFHGPASYHLYRGTTLVGKGFYGDGFVTHDRITRAEAIEDVGQFFSTLMRVHPNLLAKITSADYEQLRRRTLDGIGPKLDADGKIAVEDLALLLYYAAAAFQDGHTSVQWRTDPFRDAAIARRFPAFELGFDHGRFLITAAEDRSTEGMELVAVGQQPIQEFLRPILAGCSGETLAFRAARFTTNQPFWFYLTNLFGSAQTVPLLLLRERDGRERQGTAATLDATGYPTFVEHSKASKPRPNRHGTDLEFLAGGRVVHFLYESFRFNEEEKKKIDDIFRRIRATGSSDLIIDLRGNGGGNSTMGDYIFSYLYRGGFRQYSSVKAKVSPDIRATLPGPEKAAATAFAPALDGKVITQSSNEESVPKPDAFFAGRKYLLTDHGTFSSAADFSAMFRDYAVGTILGYETGGLAVSFGDVYSFTLQNSWIPCGVSWKQFFGPKPREDDDRHGVLPDAPMNEKRLAEFKNDADPVLSATLKYIAGTGR